VKDLSVDQIGTIYARLTRRLRLREVPEAPAPSAGSGDPEGITRAGELLDGLGTLGIIIVVILVLGLLLLLAYSIYRHRMVTGDDGPAAEPGGLFTGPRKFRMNLQEARAALNEQRFAESIAIMSGEFLKFLEDRRVVSNPWYMTNRELRIALKARDDLHELFDPISLEQERIIYGHRDADVSRLSSLLERLEAL
jgi:hypothetical protein